MSRKQKPTNQERLQAGYFRPSRHGPLATPSAPGKPPAKPQGLSSDLEAAWDRLIGTVGHRLEQADGEQFLQLVRWVVQTDRLLEELARREPGSVEHSRCLRAAVAAASVRNALASRFGLDPVGRSRLPVPPTGSRVLSRPPTALDRAGKPIDLEKKFFGDDLESEFFG